MKISLAICCLLFTGAGYAQWVDNTSTFKNVSRDSYFRLHYDNDYFTKMDYYYTQGITAEYVRPELRKNPVNKILLKPMNSDIKYGLSLNIFGYTPTSIRVSGIQYGDRPYASNLSARAFLMGSDTVRKQRIASSISIGVIGKAAGGNAIQTNIHKWTGNPKPLGWHNQVRNDLILNYQVNYEKRIWQPGERLLVNLAGEARVGTINTNITAGFNFMTGNFNDPYAAAGTRQKKVAYYFFGQVSGHAIGYDASMQGGLFNKTSPYTIHNSDINRLTAQADAGIVVNLRSFYIAYTQSVLTREFRGGDYHRWGGFNIGFAF